MNFNNTVVDVKDGSHQIAVVPVDYRSKEGDKNFSVNLDVSGLSGSSGVLSKIGLPGGLLPDFKVGLDIDLSALGIDPKDMILGTPSGTARINYTARPITNAVPEITGAVNDFDGRVSLTFLDKYDADFYRIFIRDGKDVTYVDFDPSSEAAASLAVKENSRVTVTLDPQYLQENECMVPELDRKYQFVVKLQKYAVNFLYGNRAADLILDSKESKSFEYIPHAAWKNAPVISFASRTAEGQVTLRWEHDDNGLGCEYKVTRIDTFLGVKKGSETVGIASGKEFVISDLMDGSYTFTVTPLYGKEEGFPSEPASAEVKNSWSAVPSLTCVPEGNTVTLKWTAPEGVENYHITVYAGTGSLLKYIRLDYEKYEEFDVPAEPGPMTHTYTCPLSVDSENGLDLKFEIYAVRRTASGSEQHSPTASRSLKL